MTDVEIGLIKAMLARGMKNRDIQFYFNRQDRPVNSGRITQIRSGTYGPDVPKATELEVDNYLASFTPGPIGAVIQNSTSTLPLADRAKSHFEKRGSSGWFMKTHETDQAECKQSFGLRPDNRIGPVLRAIAGLANNSGGLLFFGIEELANNSLKVVGLSDFTAFGHLDPAEINRLLASALDPVPTFAMELIEISRMKLGVIDIAKHHDAPIVATKNVGNDFKEGAIYYRYVGETRVIKPGELRHIIAERERRAVEEFARSMERVARGSVATLDLDSGQVRGKGSSFVIDEDLLKKIQFIREGDFTEIYGAPALRLIGEVTATESTTAQRTRIVRQNVTPDAVIRNFLETKEVADPIHYILSLAHVNREWLPLWYYVHTSRLDVNEIIDALQNAPASQPSHRKMAIQRLLRTKSAFKAHLGTPKKLLNAFHQGQISEPQGVAEDSAFALAVQGLPEGQKSLERFRQILLDCFDRAQGTDSKSKGRRSSIYRAACRIDELLYRPAASPEY